MKLPPLLVGASLALLSFVLSLSAEPVLKLGTLTAEGSTQPTAKQLLKAAEQGQLSLDCTVEELLPYADVPNWRWYPAMVKADGLVPTYLSIDLRREKYKQKGSPRSWSLWPELGEEGVVVFAWVQGGRCIAVNAVRSKALTAWSQIQKWTHNPSEGFPMVLAWQDGRFLRRVAWPAGMAEACVCMLSDDAARLEALLQSKTLDPSVADAEGNGLVGMAVKLRAKSCLRTLLASKAPVLPKAEKGKLLFLSPMELAAAINDLEAAEALYAAKAKVGGRDQELMTPLYLASSGGHVEMVRWLLEHKASVDEWSSFIKLPLGAALENRQFAIADLLLAKGARLEMRDEHNKRFFIGLCQRGDEESVRFFLEKGSRARDEADGRLPLVEAAARGSAALAELLLAKGAKVNDRDGRGRTALLNAAAHGNLEFAKILFAAGADASIPDKSKTSALHAAALADKPEMVSLLLEHGAPIGLKNKHELTPLDYSVIIGSGDCALRLLNHGSTLDYKSPLLAQELESVLRSDQDELLAQMLQSGLSAEYELRGWKLAALAQTVKAERCLAVLKQAGADLSQPAPYPLVSARSLEPGFKYLKALQLEDPRPADWDLPAAKLKLKFLVDGRGEVVFSELEECSDRQLCLMLSDISKHWRFTPPMKDGTPAAIWVSQELSFPSAQDILRSYCKFDTPPKPTKQQSPVYPMSLRRSGVMGEALISFVVGTDGVPFGVRCIKANHYEFAGVGEEAVRMWRFKPATLKGKPVPAYIQIPLVFILN